jgi:tetratricopeptide (TPR) repeat protein
LELAENIYREAMEEAEKTQDPAVLARGLHGQGQVAWRRGDLKAATEVMRRALVVCAKHRDKQGAAEVMRTLWEVVLQRGDLQLADDLIRQALSLYEGLGSQLGVAECLAGQGMIALRMGNPAQASHLYQRAIELFESLGAQTGVAECLTGLAEVAQAQGDFLAAESWSRRALLLQEAGGAGDAIVAQFNLGLALLLGADREDDARAHFEKLREVAESEGRRGLLACVHANLLLCAALRRDWVAWDHHISQTAALLQETQLVDPNLAEPLDRAAELALGAKDRRRALDACAMALAQWRALQKPDRLARAQRVIQAIQTGALPALPPPPPS